MSENIFTGYAEEKKFSNGGSIVKLSWKVDQLQELIDKYSNEKGYVNIDLKTSQNGGKKYMTINTWGLTVADTEQATFAAPSNEEVDELEFLDK